MGMMDIIDAIIRQESGGNPNLRNPKSGAMGLMQVMPDTARNPGFGIQPLNDPWNPTENRRFGTDYFRAMERRYPGDRDAALAAYNWGPGNADKWVQSGKTIPLPAETQNYIRSINAMTGGGQPQAVQGATPMQDPFAQLWQQRQDQAQNITSIPRTPPPMPPAPMQPPAPPRQLVPPAQSMSIGNGRGGGESQGYFGQLFENPMFLMGLSTLGAGLSGQDAGTGMMRGAQVASTMGDMSEKRRRAAAFSRLFSDEGGNAPIMKNVPAELRPIIKAMGPQDGMDALVKLAFQRLKPEDLMKVSPGDTVIDPRTGKEVYRAPGGMEKPPSGYRHVPGGELEAIPGGPATTIPADQAGRLALIRTAKQDFESAKQLLGPDMSHTAKAFNYGETGGAERTVRTAIEATLRAMTGAAAPPAEVANYEKMFGPTIWDNADTRLDKLRRLENFINEAESILTQGRGPAVTTMPKNGPGAQSPASRKPAKQMTDDELKRSLGL